MKHPYLYLWGVSLISLISFLCYSVSDSTLDINVGDTYYVIRQRDAYVLLAILYFIIGLPYLFPVFLKKKLYKWAVYLHVWGSIAFFVYLFIYLFSLMYPPASLPERYYTNSAYPEETVFTMLILVLFFILIQIVALVNCVVALIDKPNN